MDYGFDRILREYPGKHEAFFIFDADNLLSRDYVTIMNDAFDQGYLALTSYATPRISAAVGSPRLMRPGSSARPAISTTLA